MTVEKYAIRKYHDHTLRHLLQYNMIFYSMSKLLTTSAPSKVDCWM